MYTIQPVFSVGFIVEVRLARGGSIYTLRGVTPEEEKINGRGCEDGA